VIDVREDLEGITRAHQDSVIRGLPTTSDERQRRRHPQCTRVPEDEDGERRERPTLNIWPGSERAAQPDGGNDRPEEEREASDCQHGGDEVLENAVSQLNNAGLHRPSFLDFAGNLIQERILARRDHLNEKCSGFIDAAADYSVARGLLLGNRLAGGHRLVNGRCALDDRAVNGDVLPRLNPDTITDLNIGDGDLLDLTVGGHTASGFGLEIKQILYRLRSTGSDDEAGVLREDVVGGNEDGDGEEVDGWEAREDKEPQKAAE